MRQNTDTAETPQAVLKLLRTAARSLARQNVAGVGSAHANTSCGRLHCVALAYTEETPDGHREAFREVWMHNKTQIPRADALNVCATLFE